MKTWDAVIVGGGIIGISLALELRRHGGSILVVDRTEPGREASSAAAGMLAEFDPEMPAALRDLVAASSRMYPEFLHQIEDESGLNVDLRAEGTILLGEDAASVCPPAKKLTPEDVARLEPGLSGRSPAWFLPERTLDPRMLIAAVLKAAKHRGIEVAFGDAVTELLLDGDRVTGVRTGRTHFSAPVVVNCAGAWASELVPQGFPARPVKGQMLALVARRGLLRHVVRSPEVYLVPRSDGRVIVGATVEEKGFDKRVDADTMQRLRQAAAILMPELGEARILETWAGLRPGTPDELPILGRGAFEGYFVACGHYRNGILLAPATATSMAQLIRGEQPSLDLGTFSPTRFE
ncbi:MAG: glycine oxidase ThiO [Candidatus Korobacteraceae bacterium]